MKKVLFPLMFLFISLGIQAQTLREQFLHNIQETYTQSDFASFQDFSEFLMLEADKEGVNLEEEKGAWTNVARVVWNALRPSTAHGATHDGYGNCNSGCGNRTGWFREH